MNISGVVILIYYRETEEPLKKGFSLRNMRSPEGIKIDVNNFRFIADSLVIQNNVL